MYRTSLTAIQTHGSSLVRGWRAWWRSLSPTRQDRFAALAPLAAVLMFMAAIVAAFWYLRTEEAEREHEALRRDGGTVYHARLLDSRLSWQFNLRQRLRLAVQTGRTDFDTVLNPGMGDSELSDIGTQLVYSYKIDPRTVFYAGYSDSYVGSDSVDSFQTGRSLFLKLGYAWQP